LTKIPGHHLISPQDKGIGIAMRVYVTPPRRATAGDPPAAAVWCPKAQGAAVHVQDCVEDQPGLGINSKEIDI